MYSVTASFSTNDYEKVTGRFSSRRHNATTFNDADAHHVDQRIVIVGIVELYLSADVRDSDAVSVVRYSLDYARNQVPGAIGARVPESQGVK